jgi:hypothetical protein
MREASCERLEYETWRKKRIPIDGCVGAVAHFCDCRVWREKNQTGETRYVFFGLRSDVAVAHYLTELIDTAVRSGLGRYKTSPDYRRFRHKERHGFQFETVRLLPPLYRERPHRRRPSPIASPMSARRMSGRGLLGACAEDTNVSVAGGLSCRNERKA